MITLKNVLLVNALSSGATGLLLALMPQTIANLFGANQSWPFLETGIFLIVFALLVFYAYTQKSIKPGLVKTIIYLDTTWVIGSMIIVVFTPFNLSVWGYVLITAVALWVAAMAYLQNLGLKKAMAVNT